MEKPQTATILRPDGTCQECKPQNGREFTLEELQRAVGGFIERVQMKPGNGHTTMYVNEDGKRLNLRRNVFASKLAVLFRSDFISGNAILVGRELK